MEEQMNERERFLATVLFQSTDKIPMETMGPRESTLAAWRSQGLPEGKDWFQAMCEHIGIDYDFPKQERIDPGVSFKMIPTFEEKVLEHKNGHYLISDWMGNIVEISDTYDYTYIRSAKDFVTRKWHKFPVENRSDFEAMKQRYRVDDPTRFPEDFPKRAEKLKDRDYPVQLLCAGPFWQMREWCGFEPLCLMFMDDPSFIEEMCAFWSDFVAAVLERSFEHFVPDFIHFNEDMAYKGASMISPEQTRNYLAPLWKRWGDLAREAGVPVIDMDSDGNIDELIPIWIDSGINLCDPIEAAAGCDINEYRKRFGTRMAYAGGFDKRAIAAGAAAIDAEWARLEPVIRSGGYIPGCDHGMPPDISWQNLLSFGRRWAEMTGWL
jgi:uroporphyrinogen decarboxylase